MDFIDTYVIFSTELDHCWAAFNLRTHCVGAGVSPQKALADALRITETASEPTELCTCSAKYHLIYTLAKIAQSLPKKGFTPGVVYKYERAREGINRTMDQ